MINLLRNVELHLRPLLPASPSIARRSSRRPAVAPNFSAALVVVGWVGGEVRDGNVGDLEVVGLVAFGVGAEEEAVDGAVLARRFLYVREPLRRQGGPAEGTAVCVCGFVSLGRKGKTGVAAVGREQGWLTSSSSRRGTAHASSILYTPR